MLRHTIALHLLLACGQLGDSAAKGQEAAAGVKQTDLYGDPLPEGAIARCGTERLRHRNSISTLAYTKDGKFLFAGGLVFDTTDPRSRRNSVRVWDAASGKLIRSFGIGRFGGSFALSPDGQILAANSGAGKVQILDAKTGFEIRECELNGGTAGVRELVFTPSGKVLACCGNGIQFFDPTTGRRLNDFESDSEIGSIAFSPDGRHLASAETDDGKLRLRETATGKLVREFSRKEVNFASFSPDGKLLAAVQGKLFEPGIVRLWDVGTAKEFKSFKHNDRIDSIAFSPDGRTLASGGRDEIIKLWDVVSGKEDQQLRGHRGAVYSLAFAPDGKTLASGSEDQTVRLWDPATGKSIDPATGHLGLIDSLAFSADGKTLASASWDGTTRLWSPITGKELHRLDENKAWIHALAFSPDDKTVVTSSGSVIRLWEHATGQELRSFSASEHEIRSLCYSSDGKQLITAGYDHTIRAWDVATGREVRKVAHSGNWNSIPIIPVTISPGGRLLASGEGYDQGIFLRATDSGKEVRRFGEREQVTTLAFAPDGLTLAQGHGYFGGPNIRIWDTQTGKEMRPLKGHEESTDCLAFSSDGRVLVTGGEDETVRLWEIATGEEIRRWQGHDGRVNAVAYSPDHRMVASTSWDKTILVWDVTDRLQDGRLRPAHLSARQLDVCWAKLAGEGGEAYRAAWTLAASEQSVAYLKERLRPVPPVTAERVTRLIAELDSDDFATREKATKELEELEEQVEAALREAATSGSVETKNRANRLLEKLSRPVRPVQLRRMRAVAALEYAGKTEARSLLTLLADGDPQARLTSEAKAALERLEKEARRNAP
jgi:WD40 repeat protein